MPDFPFLENMYGLRSLIGLWNGEVLKKQNQSVISMTLHSTATNILEYAFCTFSGSVF